MNAFIYKIRLDINWASFYWAAEENQDLGVVSSL